MRDAKLCFHFTDSLTETAFNFLNGRTFAQVSSLVEVQEIGSQFFEKFLRRSVAHEQSIVQRDQSGRKITPINSPEI